MNLTQLKQRSDDWLLCANAVGVMGQWPLAYYLAGYAVEFLLKACILSRMVETGLVFADAEKVKLGGKDRPLKLETFRTHDLEVLLDLAGLRDKLEPRRAEGDEFGGHWEAVLKWHSESRYEAKSKAEAERLIRAVSAEDGVLPWLKTFC